MTDLQRVRKVCKWLIYMGYAENDKELAELLGYTKSSLSQILNGKVPLSDKFIDKLCNIDENINKVWIVKGEEKMLLSSDLVESNLGIPLLPFDAFAGIGDSSVKGVNFDTIEERYVIPLFDGLRVDFMLSIRGSSMYPKYSSGDVVACKLVKELLFVQWNKVYVVDSISQGILMKRLLKSEDPDKVICRSDNKDYGDFEVPFEDIRNIALVVGVIRLE